MSAPTRTEALLESIGSVRRTVIQTWSKSTGTTSTTSGNGKMVPLPRLVAVSKTKPVEDLVSLYTSFHQRHFGENYIKELIDKSVYFKTHLDDKGDKVKWHFIGSLQSNKIKQLVLDCDNLYAIETLDSVKKANIIETALVEKSEKTVNGTDPTVINVFIQVNTSLEENKSGILSTSLQEIKDLAVHIISNCPHVRLRGFMTIGSVAASNSSDENPDFKSLRSVSSAVQDHIHSLLTTPTDETEPLKTALNSQLYTTAPSTTTTISSYISSLESSSSSTTPLDSEIEDSISDSYFAFNPQGNTINFELSMGMSSDFVAAINSGSSNVRVGSTIFGLRDYSNKS